jgi:hypothetical protein
VHEGVDRAVVGVSEAADVDPDRPASVASIATSPQGPLQSIGFIATAYGCCSP